ncbi:MAG: hypothetical protein CVV47_05885 [Spirochaetae bacterium HGW-Spirochaetae-3]|jgi:tetratricopeptide (TPR) repeat protein|nr:MAG: hypothetical protein CVV47_05885 [Spirochaetae bacterium HGW-Spirochaetae-3]
MIYCCVSIDYLSQLERSGVREVSDMTGRLYAVAADFGAVVGSRKEPLVIAFPTGGMFDGIQVAEALLRIVDAIDRYKPFLRGASLVVHDTEAGEDALAFAQSTRYRDLEPYSYTFSPEAAETLSDYFRLDDGLWKPPVHSSTLHDADAALLFERPQLAATLAKAAALAKRFGPRLVQLEAGPGVRSIETLALSLGMPTDRMLILDGARTRPLPFSPLVEVIAAKDEQAEPVPLPDDVMAFRFIASSSFSGGAPESVSKGCAAYIDRWLDRFGAEEGIVLCDDPGRFSPEALELIAHRLSAGRGSERYLSVSDAGLVASLSGSWAARVPTGAADADDKNASIGRALGATEGSIRSALTDRFNAISDRGAETGAETGAGSSLKRVLHILPREASLYLYALAIVENELSPSELSEFVESLGLKPEGETLLRRLLSRTGLVEPLASRTLIRPMDPGAVVRAIGAAAAETIQERLSGYLIGLYRAGRIRPSLGFLRRVGERPEEERLLYDCLFAEVMRPDRPPLADPSFLSQSSASAYRYWAAMTIRDRYASEAAAAAAEEKISGPRAQAVRALVRSELAYSGGDPERSSKGAREAMLALGKGAPPKLEARSQRMMGLSALALDRHTEAIDYLTNAQELSETAGDDYERMMAAYAKAIVEFLSGALGRSLKALRCSDESAARLFRMDARAAIEALRGRIDMELGAYDDSARRFAALVELAAEYAVPEAGRRAAIWRARALAYTGEYDEAASILDEERDDPEARTFRGEMEILRGRPHDAGPWLEASEEPAIRLFDPPDAFDWTSLFSEIEGRGLGFDSANAPLAEFRTALSLFARGLEERDPGCASRLHALTRAERVSKNNPGMGNYSFFCFLLEERLQEPPVDKQTVLSRAFKILQQRAGRIEDRAQRALYMEKNAWNKRLIEAARTHKFI